MTFTELWEPESFYIIFCLFDVYFHSVESIILLHSFYTHIMGNDYLCTESGISCNI